MQEVRVDHSELTRLVEKLEQSPQMIQEAKRRAFEAAAPKLKALVEREIGGSGKVRSWQEKYVGSKGGYAAVRPKADTYAETKGRQSGFRRGPKRYAVGYITNAVNSGHRTPRDKWGYRSSAGTIPGQRFYQRAQEQVEMVAQEAVNEIAQALTDYLEG